MAGRGSSRVHYCAAEPHFYIARRTVIEYTVIVVFLSSQNIFRDERKRQLNGAKGKNMEYGPENTDGKEKQKIRITGKAETASSSVLEEAFMLRYSARLHKCLDNIPGGVGVYEITPQGLTLLYLNDGFFRMMNYSSSIRNRIRKSHDEADHISYIHEEDRGCVLEAIEKLLSGAREGEISCRLLNARGQSRWIHIAGRRVESIPGHTYLFCSFFDIDKQMRAQLALENEQTLLDVALKNSKMSFWEYDPAKGCLRRSAPSSARSAQSPVIENFPDCYIKSGRLHPESEGEFLQLFSHRPKRGDVLRADLLMKDEGEDYSWRRIILAPVFDASGVPVEYVGTETDITEEYKLKQKFSRQLHLLNTANSPNLIAKALYNLEDCSVVYYHSQNKDGVDINNAKNYEEVIRSTAEKFLVPEEGEKFRRNFDCRELLSDCANGENTWSMEYRRRCADGVPIWARTAASVFQEPDTGAMMIFLYSYDITEQKITSEMINAVLCLDYDYLATLNCLTRKYMVYANPEAGTAPVPCFHPDTYEQEVEAYAKKYLRPEDIENNIRDMSIAHIKEELKDKDHFISYFGVAEPGGRISRKRLQFSFLDRASELLLISRADITEIYEKEQQRLTELQRAMATAERAGHAKTDFLARMSHDLRTPMNAIMGLTQLAADETENPKAVKEYIEQIRASGGFMLRLINDCLDMEKISTGKMELHPAPYSCSDFLKVLKTIFEPLCTKKKLTFEFSPEMEKLSICVDKVRLEQIFFNLISNAEKFTPEGGSIKFQVRNVVLKDKAVTCDFVVADSGVGISEEFQKKMFSPFEQEGRGQREGQQGTGLGLAIVKNIVELMKGAIAVKSAEGAGTTVTVRLTLPLCEKAPENSCLSADNDKLFQLLCGKKILLAEDHPLNSEIAQKLLARQGIITFPAANGKECVDKFQKSAQGEFAAVLMDIRMPVMDGLEAARRIRALERADASSIPIIAMSANAFDNDVKESLKAGMNAHLAKPIDPELLYKTLYDYLKKEACKCTKKE